MVCIFQYIRCCLFLKHVWKLKMGRNSFSFSPFFSSIAQLKMWPISRTVQCSYDITFGSSSSLRNNYCDFVLEYNIKTPFWYVTQIWIRYNWCWKVEFSSSHTILWKKLETRKLCYKTFHNILGFKVNTDISNITC